MSIADQFFADQNDTASIETHLRALHLIDPPEKAAELPKASALAGHRFIVPAGVKPKKSRLRSATVGATAPQVLAGEVSTAQTQKLIRNLATSEAEIAALNLLLEHLLHDFSRAADPFVSLQNFARLSEKIDNRAAWFVRLQSDVSLRRKLCRLLSWSQALSETLMREPQLLSWLDQPASTVSRPQLREMARDCINQVSEKAAQFDALRRFRQRQTLRIGLLDLERQTWRDSDDFALVTRQISDLAQVCVETALEILRNGSASTCTNDNAPFCVLLMGKGGARELNYSSDIDLIFLHDGDREEMNALGTELLRELGANSAAGQMFRVDMRLRPEGTQGPLVTPLGYALSYYESFAAPWEWQALIKVRAIAGDAKLARRFLKFTRGITWARRADDDHLQAVVDMKRRSEATPDGQNPNNVKSGPGAIRDAEWVVQQLQMMVGPQHPRARVAATLEALQVLAGLDALSPHETQSLRAGYLWLRVVEHRLQLWQERAIRVVPSDIADKAALARRLGCQARGQAAARWLDEELTRHRADIRAVCERVFWGWRGAKDEAVRRKDEASTDEIALSAEAKTRLQRLSGGTENASFPAPLSRQIRAVLPDALRGLEHAAQSERALANLERLCDSSGNRLSLLRSLGQSPQLSQVIWTVLGGAQSLADTLVQWPELLDLAANRIALSQSKSENELRADCRSYVLTFRDRRAALGRWKARETLRIALRDLSIETSPLEIAGELSAVCRACLEMAVEECGRELQPASSSVAFAVLGMGKLGGGEMHPASDADVIWAHEALGNFPNAAELATVWANAVGKYLQERTENGVWYEVDARLRPEGRSGAVAPSLDSFLHYFERESGGLAVWERQALTRARLVAGDTRSGAKLMAMIRHVAFPAKWQSGWSDELRHIKNRVETERFKQAANGFHVKLGRGALADIEWSAQWTALKFGAQHERLQTPNTLRVLQAARDAQVLGEDDVQVLAEAYLWLRRAEIRLHFALENPPSKVRENSPELAAWAHALYPALAREDAQQQFESDWMKHTTGARRVFERVRDEL